MYGRSAVCRRHSPPLHLSRHPLIGSWCLPFRHFYAVTRTSCQPLLPLIVLALLTIFISTHCSRVVSASVDRQREEAGDGRLSRRFGRQWQNVRSEPSTNLSFAQPYFPDMTSSMRRIQKPNRHRHSMTLFTSLTEKSKSSRKPPAPSTEAHRRRRHHSITPTVDLRFRNDSISYSTEPILVGATRVAFTADSTVESIVHSIGHSNQQRYNRANLQTRRHDDEYDPVKSDVGKNPVDLGGKEAVPDQVLLLRRRPRRPEQKDEKFKFCDHRFFNDSIDKKLFEMSASNSTLAERWRELHALDDEANETFNYFDNVLMQFDCEEKYSIRWGCADCKTAFKNWVCSILIPYYDENGNEPIKPCPDYCRLVENRCPYFLPHTSSQYAGEPAHICQLEFDTHSCHYQLEDNSIQLRVNEVDQYDDEALGFAGIDSSSSLETSSVLADRTSDTDDSVLMLLRNDITTATFSIVLNSSSSSSSASSCRMMSAASLDCLLPIVSMYIVFLATVSSTAAEAVSVIFVAALGLRPSSKSAALKVELGSVPTSYAVR